MSRGPGVDRAVPPRVRWLVAALLTATLATTTPGSAPAASFGWPGPAQLGGGGSSSSSGGGGGGGAPTLARQALATVPAATPTAAQIQTQLLEQIKPTARNRPDISTILQAGGYSRPFDALVPGTAQIDWYSIPAGPTGEGAGQALLLASGRLTFTASGTGTLLLALTPAGTAGLESAEKSHLRFLRLRAIATFAPVDGTPAAVASTTQLLVSTAPAPRCFGAASHNPRAPCENPSLRFSVSPSPDQALVTPNAPCRLANSTQLITPCTFGAPLGTATAQIALLGDSHAETWRGAITVVADALRWSGISLTRSSCSYTQATPMLAPELVSQCTAWRAGVVAWFQANPRVQTVFVTDNDYARAVIAPRRTLYATQVTGYLDAWRALPRSVKHIVVIRDSPYPGRATASCVDRAIRHHAQAGVVCALKRSAALQRDPALTAAYEDQPRASVIDMTDFFCDRTVCPPVIGGVLVYKDASHMTNLYGTTLGRYLLHRIDRLLAGWPAAQVGL